eukprot:1888577-Prymnesium_polylepis.1
MAAIGAQLGRDAARARALRAPRHVAHQVLGRLGLAGARLARHDQRRRSAVGAQVAVGGLAHGVDVRRRAGLAQRLARVPLHHAAAVDVQLGKGVDRDEDVVDERVDLVAAVALARVLQHARLVQVQQAAVVGRRRAIRVGRHDRVAVRVGRGGRAIRHLEAESAAGRLDDDAGDVRLRGAFGGHQPHVHAGTPLHGGTPLHTGTRQGPHTQPRTRPGAGRASGLHALARADLHASKQAGG